MKKLLEAANSCLEDFKWQDALLLKTCLCSLGIAIGITLPKKWRKPVLLIAATAFIATYIPLMIKFLPVIKNALCGKCGEA